MLLTWVYDTWGPLGSRSYNTKSVLYFSHAHLLFFITHPVPLILTATKCKSSTFCGWASQILAREVRLHSALKDVHRKNPGTSYLISFVSPLHDLLRIPAQMTLPSKGNRVKPAGTAAGNMQAASRGARGGGSPQNCRGAVSVWRACWEGWRGTVQPGNTEFT